MGVGRECSTPRTCTYCQGPYFNSPDFCDSDNDGVGDEVGTAACYCACSTTDVHAPATMGHYCLGYTRSPSPPPPTPPPPSSPVCEAPLLHAHVKDLAPGVHTVTLEYKVAAGTAYFGGAGTIARRLSAQARPAAETLPSYSPAP